MYKPMDINGGAKKQLNSLKIDKFLGVDFRSGDVATNLRRSPDCVNMTFDVNPFTPVQRTGYKRIIENAITESETAVNINGIFFLEEHIIVHAGTKLYELTGDFDDYTPTELYTGLTNTPSTSFVMSSKLYILGAGTYLQYDGTEAKAVSEIAFIPTTKISATPAGDGTDFEAVNLLTPKRKNSFIADGATAYHLDATDLDDDIVTAVVNNVAKTEPTDLSVDRTTGIVTFNVAPTISTTDNVVISFAKTTDGYADKINKCRFYGIYGGKNDTRVFVSGNPDEQNVDWQSGLYDATYFPDTGYTKIGSDSSAITGYVKQYDVQIVLKKDSPTDSTQFLRTFSLDAENIPVYALDQGAAGAGCKSHRTVANLNDEPLFLSQYGVMAAVGTTVDNQRNIQQRSELVNTKLLDDIDANSFGVVYGGKYHLFANNHVYVCDSRMRYQDEIGQIQYEWHYWENVPAKCAAVIGDYLYFGGNGLIYRFYLFDEPRAYNDDGAAILSRWTTPMLNFNEWGRLKNIIRSMIVLKPYTRSKVDVYVSVDGDLPEYIDSAYVDIFTFADVDFSRFTFSTIEKPTNHPINNKIKKFTSIQFIFKSSNVNESFGIYALQFNYTVGSKVR